MNEITEETAVPAIEDGTAIVNEFSARPAENNIQADETEIETAVPLNEDPETSLTTQEFDALRSFTSLLVGGAIEGSEVLLARLKKYETDIREEGLTIQQTTQPESSEDRVRYAVVGFLFDQQAWARRNLKSAVYILDNAIQVAERASQPIIQNRITAPIANPISRRYERLIEKGQTSLAYWTQLGRVNEPVSRELARRTYQEIIDEFIDDLADNEELQELVAQQSLGLASDVRDEIRERTVTGDNVLEGIVRRILGRTPRAELPAPSAEVRKWAQYSFEDRRENE